MATTDPYDVVIAGRGPVGAALAHALSPLAGSESGLKMLQIGDPPYYDNRPIALSWGSRLILERLGLWPAIPSTPITRIHVSQRQAFGRTLISAADYDIEALGYVASYGDLLSSLSAPSKVPLRDGAVYSWSTENDALAIACGDELIRTRLLILADGARRAAAAGEERVKPYHQSAIVCDIRTEREHLNRAWERFASEGPLALLPFRDHYALVWTVRTETAQQLLQQDDAAFLSGLQGAFGQRLGTFLHAGPRAAFPLTLRYRIREPDSRVIPIGNAAQTLHPVAGQGLNLGLRDVWELAELMASVVAKGLARTRELSPPELDAMAFSQRYARRRRIDRRVLVGLTDSLISAFGMPGFLASSLRGAALAFLDTMPPARRFLARRMMFGVRGLP